MLIHKLFFHISTIKTKSTHCIKQMLQKQGCQQLENTQFECFVVRNQTGLSYYTMALFTNVNLSSLVQYLNADLTVK